MVKIWYDMEINLQSWTKSGKNFAFLKEICMSPYIGHQNLPSPHPTLYNVVPPRAQVLDPTCNIVPGVGGPKLYSIVVWEPSISSEHSNAIFS